MTAYWSNSGLIWNWKSSCAASGGIYGKLPTTTRAESLSHIQTPADAASIAGAAGYRDAKTAESAGKPLPAARRHALARGRAGAGMERFRAAARGAFPRPPAPADLYRYGAAPPLTERAGGQAAPAPPVAAIQRHAHSQASAAGPALEGAGISRSHRCCRSRLQLCPDRHGLSHRAGQRQGNA